MIPEATVSRGHAQIRYRNGALSCFVDDGSRNHTYVTRKNEKGEPVTKWWQDRVPEETGKPGTSSVLMPTNSGSARRPSASNAPLHEMALNLLRTSNRRLRERSCAARTVSPREGSCTRAAAGNDPAAGLTERALKCDGAFAVDHMTAWRDFRLCFDMLSQTFKPCRPNRPRA